MLLQFNIDKQHIYRVDNERPVADTKNYLFAHFDFLTDEWQGITKSVNFWRKGKAITVILDDDGNTIVPWEVIKEGFFEVSCFGGDLVTNDRARVLVVRSGYKLGVAPKLPTPDAYTTIISNYNRLNSLIKTDMSGEKFLSDDGTYKYADAGTPAIAHISVNGNEQPIVDRSVDISVPTNVSQLVNDEGYITEQQSLDEHYTKAQVDEKIDGSNLYNYDWIQEKASIFPPVSQDNNAQYIVNSNSLTIDMPADYTGHNSQGALNSPLLSVKNSNIPFDIDKEILIDCVNARFEYALLDEALGQIGNKIIHVSDGVSQVKLTTNDVNVKFIRFLSFTISNVVFGEAKSSSYSSLKVYNKNDGSIRERFEDIDFRINNIDHPIKFLDLVSGTPTYVSDLEPATYIVRTRGTLRNNATQNAGFTVNVGVLVVVHSNGTATIFNGSVIICLSQNTLQADISNRSCYFKTGTDIENYGFESTSKKVNKITDSNKNSTDYYPSVKAVTDYVNSLINNALGGNNNA